MATQGHTTIDFGAFPGNTEATVAVTGQAAIVAGSDVEAWLRIEASADHSADEHWAEQIELRAGDIVSATGFTIRARTLSPPEPQVKPLFNGTVNTAGTAVLWRNASTPGLVRDLGGKVVRLYGVWNVSWVWN